MDGLSLYFFMISLAALSLLLASTTSCLVLAGSTLRSDFPTKENLCWYMSGGWMWRCPEAPEVSVNFH